MQLRKGYTAEFTAAFKKANGDPINLTNHIVRFIVVNKTDSTQLFQKQINTFSGAGSSIASISIADTESAEYTAREYRYLFELQFSNGKKFASRKRKFVITEDGEASFDEVDVINDDILVYSEDDITVPIGSSSYLTTSITLTDVSFNEGIFNNQKIATIVADGLPAPSFTISGADASFFSVSGNNLLFTGTADFETKPSYSITINSTNSSGTYSEAFTINVGDIAGDSIPGDGGDSIDAATYQQELQTLFDAN